jgi:hypothetical protein
MKIHKFNEDDLRVLASLAIDLCTDHLYFKVFTKIIPKENYWSIDCRFTHDEEKFDEYYDSLSINSGRDNEPETYQMSWNVKKGEYFDVRPITSPFLVVFQFSEMCKKSNISMN